MKHRSRADLSRSTCVVVKVGSALLAESNTSDAFTRVASQLATIRGQTRQVVLVSSGAIALGLDKLNYASRPTELRALQACAAAGQGVLLTRWDHAFALHNLAVAQVLLTHADLQNRRRFVNARGALECLIERGVVPIVNENDTVSIDEIKVGDNDTLAAEVAGLVGADLMVLLTTADGLRTADPRTDPTSERIPLVDDIAAVERYAAGASTVGTGGMRTKLAAARIARAHGAATVIASGDDDSVLAGILAGADIGTLVLAPSERQASAKKRWLSSTVRPRGTLVVDTGARVALQRGGASLLAAGITEVRGVFVAGEAVEISSPDGVVFAQGLVAFASTEIMLLARKRPDGAPDASAQTTRNASVIHRDDLALLSDD